MKVQQETKMDLIPSAKNAISFLRIHFKVQKLISFAEKLSNIKHKDTFFFTFFLKRVLYNPLKTINELP